MPEFINPYWASAFAALSIATFVLYLLVTGYVIINMHPDYFIRLVSPRASSVTSSEKETNAPALMNRRQTGFSINHLAISSFKTLLGVVLVLLGIALLFLPGQGLLTILIGLSILPFPGKSKVIGRIIAKKSIQNTLNWIRRRAHKPPFNFPSQQSHD